MVMLKTRLPAYLAAVFLVVAVCLPYGTALHAETPKERMAKNKQKHTKLYQRMKVLGQEKGALSDIIAALDGRVDSKEKEISQIRSQLDNANQRKEDLLTGLSELEGDLAENKTALGQRARAIYMQGEMSYLELLFQSSGFSDLVDRVFFVQAILEHDEQLVSSAEQMKGEMIERERTIDSQISEIDAIVLLLEDQLAELENLKSTKQFDLDAISRDQNLTKRQADELEVENKRIIAELREIANSASGYKGKPWTGSFTKPCSGSITSGFGYRIHPVYKTKKKHTGVDIGAPKGTTIKAAGKGKVIFTGTRSGYGKTVMIDHGNGRVTLYAHMSRISCDAGDIVDTRDKIGEVGSTGVSTGNHVHFEVRINGNPVDPMKEL